MFFFFLLLPETVEMVKRKRDSGSFTAVGRGFGFNESTKCDIYKTPDSYTAVYFFSFWNHTTVINETGGDKIMSLFSCI